MLYDKQIIAGVDEAGRGPLFGPVVACAVVFNQKINTSEIIDSKKISPRKRKKVYSMLLNSDIDYGIGVVHEDVIDKINILNATDILITTPRLEVIGNKTHIGEPLRESPAGRVQSFSAGDWGESRATIPQEHLLQFGAGLIDLRVARLHKERREWDYKSGWKGTTAQKSGKSLCQSVAARERRFRTQRGRHERPEARRDEKTGNDRARLPCSGF